MRRLILGLAGALLLTTPALSARPPVEITDLCREAVQASVTATSWQQTRDLFLGRLEVLMSQHDMKPDMRKLTQMMCQSYHRGYILAIEYVVAELEKVQPKSRVKGVDELLAEQDAVRLPPPPPSRR